MENCWVALACLLLGASMSYTQSTRAAALPHEGNGDVLTIVVVGDIGPSVETDLSVDPEGAKLPYALSEIQKDINGDLNFMNLEGVVTDRSDLVADDKSEKKPFHFRIHPAALRYLVSIGFNLISLANNHSMDFGVPGLKETIGNVESARERGVLAASGIGENRERAGQPKVIYASGNKIGFSAIGIVTNNLPRHRAGIDSPGQMAYRFDEDFDQVLRRLMEQSDTAYRVLSIHYGSEGQVRADALQIAQWRRKAALTDGVDLIVGHHAHVVRAVEIADRSVIFYGLGNFLLHQTLDIRADDVCRDYGLMARVYLRKVSRERLEVRAIEVIPVIDTHLRPRRLTGAEGARRVHVLNYLAETVDDPAGKAHGVRFTPQQDGSGLYCVPGADQDPGRIAELCRDFTAPPSIPADLRSRIARSCSR